MCFLSKNFDILFVLVAICLFSQPAEAKYGGGTGEPNDPYLIYTAEQMNTIGTEPNDWNKHLMLMADIDLAQYTEQEFNLIGSFEQPFHGIFDGNRQKIANFSYSCTRMNFVGLFRFVDGNNAEIRNLCLSNPCINIDPLVDCAPESTSSIPPAD